MIIKAGFEARQIFYLENLMKLMWNFEKNWKSPWKPRPVPTWVNPNPVAQVPTWVNPHNNYNNNNHYDNNNNNYQAPAQNYQGN